MGGEKGTKQKQKIKFVEEIRQLLPLEESFDVTERNITIGGKDAYLYFAVGFVKDHLLQLMITDFQNISPSDMKDMNTAGDFIKRKIPFIQLNEVYTSRMAAINVLSGMTALVVEGFNTIILMDLRNYPARSIAEPDKEKSLRGCVQHGFDPQAYTGFKSGLPYDERWPVFKDGRLSGLYEGTGKGRRGQRDHRKDQGY